MKPCGNAGSRARFCSVLALPAARRQWRRRPVNRPHFNWPLLAISAVLTLLPARCQRRRRTQLERSRFETAGRPSSAAAGGDKKETIRLESFSLPIIVGVAAAAAAAVVVVACVTSPEGERDVSVGGGG